MTYDLKNNYPYSKHFTNSLEVVEVVGSLGKKSYFDAASCLLKNKTARLHFNVDQYVLHTVCEQRAQLPSNKKNTEKFLETVFDTMNFDLLKDGLWFIYRDNKPILRKVTKTSDNTLNWRQIDDESQIKAALEEILNLKPKSSNLTAFAPYAVASLSTTRITLDDALWIDFSSWDAFGKRGMYVVGSAKLEKGHTLNNLASIFQLDELKWAPSKWFVAMSDAFPKGFKESFKKDTMNDMEKEALLYNPIYRDGDENPITKYHPIPSFDDSEESDESK